MCDTWSWFSFSSGLFFFFSWLKKTGSRRRIILTEDLVAEETSGELHMGPDVLSNFKFFDGHG